MSDYKRMFELKQEDWFAACKEIDQLRAENERMRAVVAAAEQYRRAYGEDHQPYIMRDSLFDALAALDRESFGQEPKTVADKGMG